MNSLPDTLSQRFARTCEGLFLVIRRFSMDISLLLAAAAILFDTRAAKAEPDAQSDIAENGEAAEATQEAPLASQEAAPAEEAAVAAPEAAEEAGEALTAESEGRQTSSAAWTATQMARESAMAAADRLRQPLEAGGDEALAPVQGYEAAQEAAPAAFAALPGLDPQIMAQRVESPVYQTPEGSFGGSSSALPPISAEAPSSPSNPVQRPSGSGGAQNPGSPLPGNPEIPGASENPGNSGNNPGANNPGNPSDPGNSGANNPANPSDPGNSGADNPANPSDPGNSGATNPSNPSTPGNSGATNPANPSGPGSSGATNPSNPSVPGNSGANDPVVPPVDPVQPDDPATPDKPEAIVSLASGVNSYQGEDGVNTLFEGVINCYYGTFNPSTKIVGGKDCVNTLSLKLVSDEQFGESKGGTTTNIQNVELIATGGEKHVDVTGMNNVQNWTLKGSPITVSGIDNPACSITLENIHSGGDVFDLADGVAQADGEFLSLILGSAAGLIGDAACHSTTFRNVKVIAGEDSGEGMYLNFTELENLVTDAPIDFVFDLHCNPRTINGSGTFNLASLNGSGIPQIDGGADGCNLDLGPASFNNDTYWINFAMDSYGRPCASWQHVNEIVFNGKALYMGDTEGLKTIEFTPLAMGKIGTTIQATTIGESEFTLRQHISGASGYARIDGDVLETVNWILDGKGECGKSTLNTSADIVNIDASGVSGTIAISDLTVSENATVTYKGFAGQTYSLGQSGATIDWFKAANVDLAGGAGNDSFSVIVSESAVIAGNGGNDSFSLKAGNGATVVMAKINASDAGAETISLDASGGQRMHAIIDNFGAGDSLQLANGALASASAAKLALFGISASGELVEENGILFDGKDTAWAFVANSAGQDMICIELNGVSATEASLALAA